MYKKKYIKRLKKDKKQEQKQAVPKIPTADKHHSPFGFILSGYKEVKQNANQARIATAALLLQTKPEKSSSRFVLQDYVNTKLDVFAIVSDIKIDPEDPWNSQLLVEQSYFSEYKYTQGATRVDMFRKLATHLWIRFSDITNFENSDGQTIYISVGDTIHFTAMVGTYRGRIEHGFYATKFGLKDITIEQVGMPYVKDDDPQENILICSNYQRKGDWVAKLKVNPRNLEVKKSRYLSYYERFKYFENGLEGVKKYGLVPNRRGRRKSAWEHYSQC